VSGGSVQTNVRFSRRPSTLREKHRIDDRGVILARYRQILSPRCLSEFTGLIINIQHCFRPAFVGAGPDQQAADHGVERAVRARAVAWHLEDQGTVRQNKTIVVA
jgi:formyltetrahydrofolate hydrolase